MTQSTQPPKPDTAQSAASDRSTPGSSGQSSGAPARGRLEERVRLWARSLDLFGTQGVPRKLHRGLKSLWYFGVLAASSGAFFTSYLPLYLLSIGASATDVGLLSSLGNAVGLFGPIPGAALTRRWGKPRAVVAIFSALHRATLLIAALLPLVLRGPALVYSVIGVLALRLAFISVVNPTFVSLMGSVIPPRGRGRYLGARMMAMALASVVLVPVAGWLIDLIGEPTGYQVGLAVAFVLGLASASMALRIPRSQIQGSVEAEQRGVPFRAALRANPLFVRFLIIRLLWHFVWQVGGPYFAVYQKEVLGSSTQLIGWLATVSALSRLVGQRFWGQIVDRRGARWVFCFCTLVIPTLPFIWLVATRPWHILFVSLPGGFLWAGFNMGSLNLQLELPKPEYRTQLAAAQLMAMRVGNILGPLAGTAVIASLGYRWDFALSGFGRLLVALAFVALLRPFGQQPISRRWLRTGRAAPSRHSREAM